MIKEQIEKYTGLYVLGFVPELKDILTSIFYAWRADTSDIRIVEKYK